MSAKPETPQSPASGQKKKRAKPETGKPKKAADAGAEARKNLPPLNRPGPRPDCPSCGSKRVRRRSHAKKVGTATGAAAGAVGGATAGWSGKEVGARLGAIIGRTVFGSAGETVGKITGAILGGLTLGAVGALAGAKLGEVLDDHVFDNFECLACQHSFSE